MKTLKKIGWTFLVLLILLNIGVLVSGNSYIYKALVYNFVNIDDIDLFNNRDIAAGKPQPWPLAPDYNKHGISKELLAYHEQNQSVAYLIFQNDSLLYEQYWDGYNEKSLSNSFSMAKSMTAAMIGVCLKEGLIKSLDEPLGNYIAGYNKGRLKEITIRHALNMSTGLNWDESYSSLTSPTTKAYYGNNLEKLMSGFDVEVKPGTEFNYQSGVTQLLAFVVEKASGKTLSDFMSEKLWKPMGAEHPAVWSLDHENGHEKAYCCVYSNGRDFARFGKLYMHNGKWNGQQLMDSAYVAESVTSPGCLKEHEVEGHPICDRYGFQWWIIPDYKGHRVFYMRGLLGQYVACVPDLNLIMVRLGKVRQTDGGPHPTDFLKYLDGAMQMTMQN